MTITLEGTRFGTLELEEDAILEFPSGLIGLPGSRYTLLGRDEGGAFLWLQSLDEPEIALPVTDPGYFFADYAVELSDAEAERIGVSDPESAQIYVTVRASERPEDFTANLLAPIVVSGTRGYQVLNEVAKDLPTRAQLFPEGAGAC